MNRTVSCLLLCLPLATVSHAQGDPLQPVRDGRLLLREGARGPAVRALQRGLTSAGVTLGADGIFGPRTEAAVRAFQTRERLLVDGVVGPETLGRLDGLGAPPAPRVAPAPGAANLPPRPTGAVGGARFLSETAPLDRAQREDQILLQLQLGNVPEFLRRFQPVRFVARDAADRPREVVVQVAPDVLAVGSDADFVRIPMGAATAQRIANLYGCSLPTRKIVDAIYGAASARLTPQPMTPSAAMTSNGYFARHQALIETQWARLGARRGELTAGHKKDVVISRRLETRPDRVAIYGWHLPSGLPIQPLSTAHTASYADYSHGVRLVDALALIDGAPVPVADVLTDPVLHPLLSDEGRFSDPRVPGVVSGPPPAASPSTPLRRLTNSEVTPAISANAVRILREHRGDPYGTRVPFVADGQVYVAVIEEHYHPPGGALRPWGPHPGVSVFAPILP